MMLLTRSMVVLLLVESQIVVRVTIVRDKNAAVIVTGKLESLRVYVFHLQDVRLAINLDDCFC